MSNKLLLKIIFAGLMPILASANIAAADHQSLSSIHDAAKKHAIQQFSQSKGQVEVIPNKLDTRLRLTKCEQPLEAKHTSNARGGRLTVNISCNGVKPWNLYVPVQIKVMQNVVVLSHSLSRDTLLSQSDLRLERRDINKMHSGYFSDLNEVIGKSLRRSISGGLALTPLYVESFMLIKRGQQVTLLAQSSGIIVKMSGKAMANGAAGERIKVKNLSSNRVIEGLITKDGQIKTHM